MNDYYTVKFVAQLFDVSMQQIYEWIEEGRIIAIKGKESNDYKIPSDQFVGKDENDDSRYLAIDPTFHKRIEEEQKELYEMGKKDLSHIKLPVESSRKMSRREFLELMRKARKRR